MCKKKPKKTPDITKDQWTRERQTNCTILHVRACSSITSCLAHVSRDDTE